MKIKLLITLLLGSVPLLNFCQTQIGQDISGSSDSDAYGRSISLSSNGMIIAVSAQFKNTMNGNSTGQVRVYENQSNTWVQKGQDINGALSDDLLGFNLKLNDSGSILVISGNDFVKAYEYQSGLWVQFGQTIFASFSGDRFGNGLDISNDGLTIAIGAPSYGQSFDNQSHGEVKVYEYQTNTWIQIGQALNGVFNDEFGSGISLSSDGSKLAVGATGFSGYIKVYENQSGTWNQIAQTLNGPDDNQRFGFDVSLSSDGSILALSYIRDSNYVKIFQNQSDNWNQIGQTINGDSDWFGF